jgi:hypothetical protein
MDGLFSFIFIIAVVIGLILIIRLFGAWMLRIDEVIKYQKLIFEELKKLNSTHDQNKV